MAFDRRRMQMVNGSVLTQQEHDAQMQAYRKKVKMGGKGASLMMIAAIAMASNHLIPRIPERTRFK